MTIPHNGRQLPGPPPPAYPSPHRQPTPTPAHPTHNMWVQSHGPAYPPPAGLPMRPPVYPAAAAPTQTQIKRRPREALIAVSLAALGLLLFTVPLLRAVLGVAAATLGVIADVRSRRYQGKQSRLGLLGGLVGLLEVTAWLFS